MFALPLIGESKREAVTGEVGLWNTVPATMFDGDAGFRADGFEADLHICRLIGGERALAPSERQPLTRRERARRAKQSTVFTHYGPMARRVLDALLDKYADEGIATIEADTVFSVQPFTDMGRPAELIKSFGGRPQYLGALQTLERELYATGAT